MTKTAFFHLRNVAKVRPFVTKQDAEKLIHAFIISRLNYCNALFTGLPKKLIGKLLLVQNSVARLLTKSRKREHITPVLATLHWLQISFRIDFKILLLKAKNHLAPSYIPDFLTPYQPIRAFRSSDAGILTVPKVAHKTSGETGFSYYAPRLWDTLPSYIRYAGSVDIFKNQLKTYLFRHLVNLVHLISFYYHFLLVSFHSLLLDFLLFRMNLFLYLLLCFCVVFNVLL